MNLKCLLFFLMIILCTFTIEHEKIPFTESEYHERIKRIIDLYGETSDMTKEEMLRNLKIAGGRKNTMNPGVERDEL